jgi:hypothetical protein
MVLGPSMCKPQPPSSFYVRTVAVTKLARYLYLAIVAKVDKFKIESLPDDYRDTGESPSGVLMTRQCLVLESHTML